MTHRAFRTTRLALLGTPVLLAMASTGPLLVSAPAAAGYCAEKVEQAIEVNTPDWLEVAKQEHCANLDTMLRPEGNPERSINPDATCDLGSLDFPGMPTFGMDIGSLNSCQILQSVSRPMLDAVSDQMNEAADAVTGAVEDAADEIVQDATGGYGGVRDGELGLDSQDAVQDGFDQSVGDRVRDGVR